MAKSRRMPLLNFVVAAVAIASLFPASIVIQVISTENMSNLCSGWFKKPIFPASPDTSQQQPSLQSNCHGRPDHCTKPTMIAIKSYR